MVSRICYAVGRSSGPLEHVEALLGEKCNPSTPQGNVGEVAFLCAQPLSDERAVRLICLVSGVRMDSDARFM